MNPSVHVACVTHSLSRSGGGISEALRRLSVELTQVGARTSVLGIHDSAADSDLPGWRPLEPRALASRGPAAIGYVPTLRRELSLLNPDIVHTHGLWKHVSAGVTSWSRKSGRPYVVSPHGMLDPWAMRRSRWKKRIAYTWYESRHIHGASLLHALNNAEFRAIRDFGLASPVAIIPNGVDLPNEREPREDIRRVVFLGRLHSKKGLNELLDGWSLIRDDLTADIQLVIAGWGDADYELQLRRKIESMHLDRAVELVGPVFGDAKTALLRDADAFILPSYSEGLPVAVLEAWSHSVPVLMTDACNLPEGFAANAALRITSEPDGIAAGLKQLLGMTNDERAKMGRRGRALVAKKFQWTSVARTFADVYRWLIDGGVAPECVRN